MTEKPTNSEIFGRKIFFVCATFTLNTNVFLRLLEQEYEVYKIDDYHQLKSLLKVNPDAIVYINADSGNPVNTWFNFINYFESEPGFEAVDFGVFASNMKPMDRQKFTDSLKLKAGFYPDNKDYTQIMKDLMEKLTALNAKGRRQFVRIKCDETKNTTAFLVQGDKMFKMQLLDISSIGCGIKFSRTSSFTLRQNAVIHDLNLVLGPKQLHVNGRIYAVKEEKDGFIVVLIFTPDTTDSFRTYVRLFIRDQLHKNLMNEAIKMPWDRTDYSISVKAEDVKEEQLTEKEQQDAVDRVTEANEAESSKIEVQYADSSEDDEVEELEELTDEA